VSGFAGPFSLFVVPSTVSTGWAVSYDVILFIDANEIRSGCFVVTRGCVVVTLQWCSVRNRTGSVQIAGSLRLRQQVRPRFIVVRPHLSHFGIGVMVLKRSSLIWSEDSLTCSGCSTFCVYIGPLLKLWLLLSRALSMVVFVEYVNWNDRLAVWLRSVKRTLGWVCLSCLAKEYWVRRELFADRTGDVRVWFIVDVDLRNSFDEVLLVTYRFIVDYNIVNIFLSSNYAAEANSS